MHSHPEPTDLRIGAQSGLARPMRRLGCQTAAELLAKPLPPMKHLVSGYIPEGLSILAGPPKLGKSWLALDLSIAVATGGLALGAVSTDQGSVLYLALEDNERRLQQRLRQRLGDRAAPEALHIGTEWPRLDAGGLDDIDDWIEQIENPRLIIIDVFGKIRPDRRISDMAYEGDYRALAPIKALADAKGVAIVIVHHTRKMAADDPFDRVSGTTGFTGAADAVLILDRNSQGTTLYGRGRDIEEFETALEFDGATGAWISRGRASEVRRSDERQAIVDFLSRAGSSKSPAEISTALNVDGANVRQLLLKMARAGEVYRCTRGQYECMAAQPAEAQPDNNDHEVTDV